MPTDPSVILAAGRGLTPIQSPLESQQEALKLQMMQQTIRSNQALEQDRTLLAAQRVRQQAGNEALAASIKKHSTTDPNGEDPVDYHAVAQDLEAAGFPELANHYLTSQNENAVSLGKIWETSRQHAKEKVAAIGDLAYGAQSVEDFTARVGMAATYGLLGQTPQENEQVARQVVGQVQAAGPDGWQAVAQHFRQFSPRWQANQTADEKSVVVPRGGTLVKAGTGEVVARGEPVPTTPRSLEQQLLEAVTQGDQAGVARISGVIQRDAALKRDPAAQALATELKNLSVEQAHERLEKLRNENKPADIENVTYTTMSGRKYVDLGDFTGTQKDRARDAANAAKLPTVNKEEAAGLKAADQARTNLSGIIAQILPYLPKDAKGRLVSGPANTLEKVFQTNPVLGAFGSWRSSAIQMIQALAEKGMGLRMNQPMIDLMLQNDIPQMTDDGPTALQRVDNIMKQLEDKEQALLVRDRSTFNTPPPPGPPAPKPLSPALQQRKPQ